MCDVEVCRICLRNDSKFYNFDEFNLKKYYEEVTNKSINKKDGLPQYFCYECATLLYKFHTFREKCYYGEKVLRDMLWNGPLTYAGIYELNANRVHRFKHMTLDILVSNKRVKTFNYHHIEEVHNRPITPKTEIVNDDFTEGPFSDDDNFACNDPETDPVDLDLSIDVHVKKDLNNDVTIDETENRIETGKTIEMKLKRIEKIDTEEETKTLSVIKKTIKPKSNVKTRQLRKSKKNTKQKRKKFRPIDSDDETDDIELSKIKLEKSTSVMSPETKRTYKFNKPKSSRCFAFLNSENWKKYNLSDEDALEEFQNKALDKKYLSAPYKCELCYKGFSQKGMLDRHIPQRHGEAVGPLVCRFCKMRFKSNYFVNLHLRQHYNKFECLRCGLVCCLENTALFHEEYHSGVKRKCPHCDKEFRHLSTFYTHLRTHRSKHMCALCGESFVSELGLRLHRKAKHRAEIEKNVVDIEEATYCDICKINFESKLAYQNHLAHSALHTEENKKLGEYSVPEKIEDEEKNQEEDDNYVRGLVNRKSMVEKELCAVRKSCKSRDSRISPKKKSMVEKELCAVRKSGKSRVTKYTRKPTACKYCEASFDSLSACLRHHLAQHRGKSFYAERVICEICGASLAVGSVAAHLNQHTRRKMYTCDTCGRSFTTSNILKNHLVTHTGEKKYACTLCDKRFTQNGSLNLHYRTFHLKQPYPKRNRRKNIDKEEECL